MFNTINSDMCVAIMWLIISAGHAFTAADKIKIAVYTDPMEYAEAVQHSDDEFNEDTRHFLQYYSEIRKVIPSSIAEGLIVISCIVPAVIAADGIRIAPAYVDFSTLTIFLLSVFCFIYLITSSFGCLYKMKLIAAYNKSKNNVDVAVRFAAINGDKIFPSSLSLVDIVVKVGIFLGALQLAMYMFL